MQLSHLSPSVPCTEPKSILKKGEGSALKKRNHVVWDVFRSLRVIDKNHQKKDLCYIGKKSVNRRRIQKLLARNVRWDGREIRTYPASPYRIKEIKAFQPTLSDDALCKNYANLEKKKKYIYVTHPEADKFLPVIDKYLNLHIDEILKRDFRDPNHPSDSDSSVSDMDESDPPLVAETPLVSPV